MISAGCPTSLVRQLEEQHHSLAPVPASSAWEPLPEKHLLSSFFPHSGFPPPLTRARKEETIHFGAHAASVAWWLCPRALGGMPAWGMRCHPAAVTPLCPADLLCPEKRNAPAPSQRGLWAFLLRGPQGSGSTQRTC